MKTLEDLLRLNKQIRVVGFDDAPFERERGSPVNITGVICAGTRFEGMLWTQVHKDGDDATDTLIECLANSKFLDQVNVVLTDGIAVGGFNLIDLPRLSNALNRPCIAVMRKAPDLNAIDAALKNFSDYSRRKELIAAAGEIHHFEHFVFQVAGCAPDTAGRALMQLTDNGHVPEALRLAHMIGAAVKTGQSSNRA